MCGVFGHPSGWVLEAGLWGSEAQMEGWWPPGKAQANTASAEKLLPPAQGQGPGEGRGAAASQHVVSRSRPTLPQPCNPACTP